jgi:hypothetical protein
MTKFKVGDQVKIVNYGHLYWTQEVEDTPYYHRPEGGGCWYDMSPGLVGKVGIIVEAHKTQGIDNYSIKGEPSKKAWYHNDQLELIHRPEYK